MKYLQSLIILLLAAVTGYGQATPPAALGARRVTAYDALVVGTKKIDSISTDTSLKGNRDGVLATQKAVRNFVMARQNYNRPVYGNASIVPINDSTVGVANYHAYASQAEYWGWDGNGILGLHTFPITSGGGVGDTTFAIKMTYAQLDGATGIPTAGKAYVMLTDTVPYRMGLFRFAGYVSGQTLDNGGTIIVTADNQRWDRIIPGGLVNGWLEGSWFGMIPDVVIPGSGPTVTGTDNGANFQKMINASAAGQVTHLGAGRWGIFTPVDTIRGKRLDFRCDGSIYTNGANFLTLYFFSGQDPTNSIDIVGNLVGRVNIPAQTKAAHDAGTGPDWPSFTGTGITILNSNKNHVRINQVEGFAKAFEVLGGGGTTTAWLGSQENNFAFQWINKCAVGISLRSLNGVSYVDKQTFIGINGGTARVSGGLAISMDGYSGSSTITGNEIYNGAFRSNVFRLMIEQVDSIADIAGDVTEDVFDINLELGTTTGVFGATGYRIRSVAPNFARDCIFRGGGSICHWMIANGMGIGGRIEMPIYYNCSTRLGGRARIDQTGKVLIYCNSSLTQFNRGLVDPSIFGFINEDEAPGDTLVTATTFTPPAGFNMIYMANGGTFTAPLPQNRPKTTMTLFNTSTTLTLAVSGVTGFTSLPPGQGIDIRTDGIGWRAKNYSVSTGGTGGGGGGGSNGPVQIAPFGSAPNGSGATYDTTAGGLTLQPADATNPGGISAAAFQQLPGGKGIDSLVARAINIKSGSNIANLIVSRANGFSVNDVNGTANQSSSTFTNYNWGSGGNTKDIYFSLGKTGITSVGFGNNGTDFVFATEKVTNGFSWRRGIGFSTASLAAGTELMHLFPNGHLVVQFGGTFTDNNRDLLQITGSQSVTGQFYMGQLASDPTTNLQNGSIYYNTATDKFRGYQGGVWVDLIGGGTGGTGGGITAFGTPGAGNVNGGTVSGSTAILHYATGSFPGIISLSAQTMGAGAKTFPGQIIGRASVAGSGGTNTAPIVLPDGGIPSVAQNGHLLASLGNLYFGRVNTWDEIATSTNPMSFYQKDWKGFRILEPYGGVPDPTGHAGQALVATSDGHSDWGYAGDQSVQVFNLSVVSGSEYHTICTFPLIDNSNGLYEVDAVCQNDGSIQGYARSFVFRVRKVSGVATVNGMTDILPENFDGTFNLDVNASIFTSGGAQSLQIQGSGPSIPGSITWKVIVKRIDIGQTFTP